MDIQNFCQNTDCIGTAAQPTEGDFSKIAQQGYRVVVNLSTCDAPNAVPDEGKWVTQYGMTYVHIPVSPQFDMKAKIKDFFAIMEGFESDQVFVHCVGNIRASIFTYLFLTLKKGMSAADAMSPVLKAALPQLPPPMAALMGLTLADIEG